jgi:hypothetical protein
LKEYTLEEEPIEMIKSYSQPFDFLLKSSVAESAIDSPPLARSSLH